MTERALVEIRNLRLGFPRRGSVHYVFRGADFVLREGEFTCLIGPSGSGKTVLLNLLIGSLRPGAGGAMLRGRIALMGHDLTRSYPRSLYDRMGVVFQESALFDDLSTFENVAFGLRRRRLSRPARVAEAERLLHAVELDHPPARTNALSGGQKKRLALARALAKDPEFLLFDEPTTGLDPRLRRQIAALIRRTHEAGRGRRTTLVVTHDYEDFLPLADRVLRIDPARGRVEEVPPGADPEIKSTIPEDTPPELAPGQRPRRLLRLLAAPAGVLLGWMDPFLRFAAAPLPSSLRQLAARLGDAVILPALYTASAGAVLGGLSTFFALENNPLKGAMDRQALIGLGKVILAIVVPLMTAVLFAARVGAGAAARLGNIRLRRGDDALRVLGADPDAYLTAPVFWSFLVGLPLLAVPVAVAAALASLGFACFTRPILPFGWARAFFSEVTPDDLRFAVIKLAGSGLLVAASAVYMGFKPKLGAEDLGRHVTGAIVAGTLLVILWHGLATFMQYG